MILMDFKRVLEIIRDVRKKRPLVHHITNYVTVNDCANITLCIGASPVMAHSPEEVSEIVSNAGALVLNIGTPDSGLLESMILAGIEANKENIPIILDPVGVGTSKLRSSIAERLIDELEISVIKGNMGEIGTLAHCKARVRGVDSVGIDGDPVEVTQNFAEKTQAIIVMSGVTDIISDGKSAFLVDNGSPMMGKITGTGCMASSVIGACAAVSKDYCITSVAALSAFGIAGERAAKEARGPGSFKLHLFDALASLTLDDIADDAKIRQV